MRLRDLPHKLKVTACFAACAAILSGSLTITGCSTPKYAAEVKDTKYTTAEYIAYLYNAYQMTFYYNNLSAYAQYGMDPWDQDIPYGEGDDVKKLKTEEYIKTLTKDNLIRQKAIVDKMKEYGLTKLSEEDEKAYNEYMNSVSSEQMIALGFSKETYAKVYKATTYNENTLFYGLYDKGGKRAMSDADIKTYYNKNIMTYKSIEIALTDDNGSDLDEKGVAEVKKKLQKYLDLFKTNKDFDKVITQYNADEEAASTTTTSGATTTTTATGTSATTAATTSSTTTTSTTAATTSTTGTGTTATGTDTDGSEAEEDSNLKTLDANTDDENIVKAVQSLKVGETKIVEYKQNGTTNTAALIFRINPEETQYKFDKSRERVIYGAKYKEFNEEIKKYIKELEKDFTLNKTVVNKCSPKKLEENLNKLSK